MILCDVYKSISKNPPIFTGINPMDRIAPWANAYLEPQQKKQSSVMFLNQLLTIHQKLSRN